MTSARVGSWAMVVLPGEVDAECSAMVGEELAAALADGVTVLIVDGTGTTFCDSSGVRTLVAAHAQAQARNAQVRLVAPSPVVQRVVTLMGLDGVLPVYPALAAAMKDAPSGDGEAPRGPGASAR